MARSVLGLLLVALSAFLPPASLLAPPTGRLWARTRESFRLPEVLLLEARMQLGPSMQTIAVDPQGSCLISFPEVTPLHDLKGVTRFNLPSSLLRCEWVGEEIASAPNPKSFLDAISHSVLASPASDDVWSLEYTCFAPLVVNELGTAPSSVAADDNFVTTSTDAPAGPAAAAAEKGFNSRGLSLRVAQLFSTPAALQPAEATCRLVLLETASALTLLRVLFPAPSGATPSEPAGKAALSSDNDDSFWWQTWAARPFQYSSACNPALADVLIDLVASLVEQGCRETSTPSVTSGSSSSNSSSLSLLDLTCGSGTLLACAARRGFVARGLDVNLRCVEGANANLAHQSISREVALATCGDATRPQALNALAKTLLRYTATSNFCEGTSSSDRSAIHSGTASDGAASIQLKIISDGAPLPQFDCVVANLPWGRHSVAYAGGNAAFLDALVGGSHAPPVLKPRAPCVFIVGAGDGDSIIEDLKARGFELCVGSDDSDDKSGFSLSPACVPPRNLNFPPSKKERQRKQRESSSREGADGRARTPSRSDCEIVVARAPKAAL